MISICILSLGRADELRQVVKHNLKEIINKKIEYEILILDNGTRGDSVMESVEYLWNYLYKIKYFRFDENIGVSCGFNYLMRRASYDIIALWGNDILLNDGWSKILNLEFNGVCAVPCTVAPSGKEDHDFYYPQSSCAVFGNWFLNRSMLLDIGLFNEEFKGYGLEDSELCLRASAHGYINSYLKSGSNHLCNDSGEQTLYRQYKNRCLDYNSKIFNKCKNEGFQKLSNWDKSIESTYKEFKI
jgi:GT2 family glycosyltransferase